MTNKTDKELAIEVAIAYIQATGERKLPNGGSANLLSFDNLEAVIKTVHKTLKSLKD